VDLSCIGLGENSISQGQKRGLRKTEKGKVRRTHFCSTRISMMHIVLETIRCMDSPRLELPHREVSSSWQPAAAFFPKPRTQVFPISMAHAVAKVLGLLPWLDNVSAIP